ncbi:MAG TPA: glutamate racemase, partial [Alphaproteobacteria bacterium]|nr:glutamate racemase [Alphaproteobacteria bacterium]
LERLREILAPLLTPPAAERPDVVVLACTHFPLLRAELEAIAPPDIAWIDSGAAVARRVVEVLPKQDAAPALPADLALTTAPAPDDLRRALAQAGFAACETLHA